MSLSPIVMTVVVVTGRALNLAMAEQKTAVEVGILACNFSEPGGPAETGRSGVELQARDVLCVFKVRSGVEETYTGDCWVWASRLSTKAHICGW